MQACKPNNTLSDQTNQQKNAQKGSDCKSPEKRHHMTSWLGRGNEKKNQNNNEPKTGHRLTNWLGQGRHYSEKNNNNVTSEEEVETIVINRKIKERVVITHAKKSTEHKDGEKHFTRC